MCFVFHLLVCCDVVGHFKVTILRDDGLHGRVCHIEIEMHDLAEHSIWCL